MTPNIEGGLNGTYELMTLPRRMWLSSVAKTMPFKKWIRDNDDGYFGSGSGDGGDGGGGGGGGGSGASWAANCQQTTVADKARRYKMPWVYGIAATLPPCVELASSWASRARMPNKGSPLEGKARHTARTDL